MLYALLSALIVSLISLVGAVFFFRKKNISPEYGGAMISLAAGVMLTAATMDLLPEAAALSTIREVFAALLAGVCVFFIMERLINWYHHHAHQHRHQDQEVKPAAVLLTMGDSLHNFFDGVAIAVAFSVSTELGLITTVVIILHEIPQELADFVTLLHSGLKFWMAVLYNLLSGLTAILGVLAGWYFLSAVNGALPYMLAFNAGMFIYVSCSDLIPALHEEYKKNRKWLQTFTFILGILVMTGMIYLLENHNESAGKFPGSQSGTMVEIQKPSATTRLQSAG